MTKKEILNKLKALALAGTISATLLACNPEDYREDYEEEKEKVIDEIVSRLKDELNTTTEMTTQYTLANETKTTTYTTITSSIIESQTIKPETTGTTETTTYPTMQTTETTNPIIQTTETTTYPTMQTTEISTEEKTTTEYNTNQYIIENDYKIKNESYGIEITDENPNLYRIALKYCPKNQNIEDFINYIKTINCKIENLGTDTLYKDEKVIVPLTTIYYNSKKSIEDISQETGISVEKIKKLNDEKVLNSNEYRDVLIKLVPLYSRSYETDMYGNALIYSNTVILGNFNPCEKTYDENYTCGGVFIEQNDNTNEYYYAQFTENGDYKVDYVGSNVESFKSINGIPIFKIRTVNDCVEYAKNDETPIETYYTYITSNDQSKYNFYKDKQGNEYYTIDKTDLSIYGYTKADELAPKYIYGYEEEIKKTK